MAPRQPVKTTFRRRSSGSNRTCWPTRRTGRTWHARARPQCSAPPARSSLPSEGLRGTRSRAICRCSTCRLTNNRRTSPSRYNPGDTVGDYLEHIRDQVSVAPTRRRRATRSPVSTTFTRASSSSSSGCKRAAATSDRGARAQHARRARPGQPSPGCLVHLVCLQAPRREPRSAVGSRPRRWRRTSAATAGSRTSRCGRRPDRATRRSSATRSRRARRMRRRPRSCAPRRSRTRRDLRPEPARREPLVGARARCEVPARRRARQGQPLARAARLPLRAQLHEMSQQPGAPPQLDSSCCRCASCSRWSPSSCPIRRYPRTRGPKRSDRESRSQQRGRRPGPGARCARGRDPVGHAAACRTNAHRSRPRSTRALALLERCIDAVADVVLAESVHQGVLGNPARQGGLFGALNRGEGPMPEIEVLETPRSGEALTHRSSWRCRTAIRPSIGPRPRAHWPSRA